VMVAVVMVVVMVFHVLCMGLGTRLDWHCSTTNSVGLACEHD